jgi:hypothetical protein
MLLPRFDDPYQLSIIVRHGNDGLLINPPLHYMPVHVALWEKEFTIEISPHAQVKNSD